MKSVIALHLKKTNDGVGILWRLDHRRSANLNIAKWHIKSSQPGKVDDSHMTRLLLYRWWSGSVRKSNLYVKFTIFRVDILKFSVLKDFICKI